MAEKYLVVLDPNTITGHGFIQDCDAMFIAGDLRCPILDCTRLDMGNPYYLEASRQPKKPNRSHQTLYIPHGSVVLIHRYAEEEKLPVGFVAN